MYLDGNQDLFLDFYILDLEAKGLDVIFGAGIGICEGK